MRTPSLERNVKGSSSGTCPQLCIERLRDALRIFGCLAVAAGAVCCRTYQVFSAELTHSKGHQFVRDGGVWKAMCFSTFSLHARCPVFVRLLKLQSCTANGVILVSQFLPGCHWREVSGAPVDRSVEWWAIGFGVDRKPKTSRIPMNSPGKKNLPDDFTRRFLGSLIVSRALEIAHGKSHGTITGMFVPQFWGCTSKKDGFQMTILIYGYLWQGVQSNFGSGHIKKKPKSTLYCCWANSEPEKSEIPWSLLTLMNFQRVPKEFLMCMESLMRHNMEQQRKERRIPMVEIHSYMMVPRWVGQVPTLPTVPLTPKCCGYFLTEVNRHRMGRNESFSPFGPFGVNGIIYLQTS